MSFSFDNLREGKENCPSDLALDKLFAGELEHEEKRTLERHVYDCESCTARMATRRQGFNAFEDFDQKAVLARLEANLPSEARAPKSPRAPWVLAFFGGFAALALTLLMVRPNAPEQPGEVPSGYEGASEPTTRLKGGLTLRVHRLRDGVSEEVLSGSPFKPGDRIRFQVSTPDKGQVAILGVEADGTLYTAWPINASQRLLTQSQDVLLDGAVELDAALGRETLWLVLCQGQESPSSCRARGKDGAPECPSGCTSTSFVMDKRP